MSKMQRRPYGRPTVSGLWLAPTAATTPGHIADGELGEVAQGMREPRPTEWPLDQQLAFYRQLMGVAVKRGYKQGWSALKFRERFGRFPPWAWNNTGPVAPSGAVEAWVRSRHIAYARKLGR